MSAFNVTAGGLARAWPAPRDGVALGDAPPALAGLYRPDRIPTEVAITRLQSVAGTAQVGDAGLGDALREAYAKLAGREAAYHDQIAAFSQDGARRDAGELLHLQAALGDASNQFALASTLARKFVSAIETLARAQ